MPERPDVVVYLEALESRVLGHVLRKAEVRGPSLLRTATPPVESVENHAVTALRRIGKRIAIGFDNHIWLVFHLMIAGRLHWVHRKVVPDGRRTLAAFEFDSGTLTATEAGARKRMSLHVMEGEESLNLLDRGGIDVLSASPDRFKAVLTSENHTLKRPLTDPRLFTAIGNPYSDEILFEAQLSPVKLTGRLSGAENAGLYEATRHSPNHGTSRLRLDTR